MSAFISKILIAFIKTYRLVLSPWLGQQCRFHPTCSQFAIQAIELHGPFRGTWLTLKRLASCHPWHEGGVDPVPDSRSQKK